MENNNNKNLFESYLLKLLEIQFNNGKNTDELYLSIKKIYTDNKTKNKKEDK